MVATYFLSIFCNKLSVSSGHRPRTPTVIVLHLQKCFATSGYTNFLCNRRAHQLIIRGECGLQ